VSAVALSALKVTLAVEVPIVALFYRHRWLTMALVCSVATGVTNYFMNTTWQALIPDRTIAIAIGEIGAFLIEAMVYAFVDRSAGIRRAFLASAVANAASFVVGL
jgi:hypothetical protein